MDFASLMNSQITASATDSKTQNGGEKKYLKRSDVEAARQAEYLRAQEELEKGRAGRVDRKRKREEEEAERLRAREEKKRRLAEESRKLAKEEAEAEERERRKRLGLPERVEKSSESESAEKEGAEDKESTSAVAPARSNDPIPTTLAHVSGDEMLVPARVPQADNTEGDTYAQAHLQLRRQLASYINLLLTEWSLALSARPSEVKESFSGKQAATNHTTAVSSLRPLICKLEKNTLSPSLLAPITEIVHLAQQRRYVDANNAYLRVSIGKAAWPIGVTMVGIHERSAREKLHEAEKKGDREAHILADEETRKMLQGIKRVLSFAQIRWPPFDLGQLMG